MAGFMMALLIAIFVGIIFAFFISRCCANRFARRCSRFTAVRARAVRLPAGAAGPPGGGGPRLADAAIAALPLTRLAQAAECAVCLGELAAGEVARLLPLCGHAFHMECVDTWLRSRANCPVCRQTVVDVNEMVLQVEMPPPPQQPRNDVQDTQPAQAQAQAEGPILLPPALPQADGRAPLAQARNGGGEGNGQQSHSLQVLD